jgi:hypothetical protein
MKNICNETFCKTVYRIIRSKVGHCVVTHESIIIGEKRCQRQASRHVGLYESWQADSLSQAFSFPKRCGNLDLQYKYSLPG